jgi:hypothetical protein
MDGVGLRIGSGIDETLSYYTMPPEHSAACGPTTCWKG